MAEIHGFICSQPVYEYDGWIFTYHVTLVWPLTKDWELRKRAGARFYDMLSKWRDEPDPEKFRLGGGCQQF